MRIGIIGSGNFSEKVYATLQKNEDFVFIGGYDAPAFKGLMPFDTLEDLVSQVDCLLIFDMFSSDYSTLSEVVKSGVHLYVESPMLSTKRELKKLDMFAYESGSQIQLGMKQRFYSFYSDLAKYQIVPRILEASRFVKFNKNSTQLSVIDDLMQHDIDVTLKLVDSEVKSIYSTAVGVYYKDPDVVNTRLEFYNGCVANLSASKIANRDIHRTKFFQNNTYCSIDFRKQLLKVQNNTPADDASDEQWGVRTTYNKAKDTDDYCTMLENEINSFYNCIANGTETCAGISQYLQLQSVTGKIKEQLERNFTTNA